MDSDMAQRIEMIAARAWPPLEQQSLNGWVLRYGQGVTRRANSVLPLAWDDGRDLAEALWSVEAYYRERGLAPRFQISPAAVPGGLDEALASRGYRVSARTAVQTASVGTVAQRLSSPGLWRIASEPTPGTDWLAVYARAEEASGESLRIRQAIMARIPDRVRYVTVYDDTGRPAAVGSAVGVEDYLGVFNVATVADQRRRGAALAVMRGLAQWGTELGVNWLYLQVMTDNAPAQALYARLGFETRYHYHYMGAARHQDR